MFRYAVVFRFVLALVAAVLVLPAVAHAQGAGGQITGVVKDTSGAVLPGVSVEVAGSALAAPREVVSDGTGQYRVVNLGPGTYTVTFTLTGFNTFKRDGLEIAGDFTATVNAEMKVGSLEETITVSGEAPIVDVQNVQRQRVLTDEIVEAVPTGKYFVNLGVLIPGVSASCSAACQGGVSQDTGGAAGDSSATLVAHGSRFRDQRISINNMTVRGSTGYLGVTGPNIEAQQETQIDTSGADTSVGTGGVRINIVPKDGGNKLSGGIFATGTSEKFQANNVTKELTDRGLLGNTKVKKLYDIAPTLGGPIKKDKLWFFLSARRENNINYAANLFENLNRNDKSSWTYNPNLTKAATLGNPLPMAGLRLTYQMNDKNKFAASYDYRDRCQCPNLGSAGTSPDAAVNFMFRPQQIAMVTWSSPITNKLLLEATAVDLIEGWGNRLAVEAGDASLVRVTTQNAPASYQGVTTFRSAGANTNWTWYPYRDLGFNATYVTGAHAFKAGVEYDWGWNDRWSFGQLGSVVNSPIFGPIQVSSYRINYASTLVAGAAGVNNCGGGQLCQPNQVSVNLDPVRRIDRSPRDGGLYVQDRYTLNHVTFSGGVRLDFFKRITKDVTEGPTSLQPTRSLLIPGQDVVNYKDLSPRLGVAYDVFGNGKTAVKASINRYVQDLSLLANAGYSVQSNYQTTSARSWTDNNGNFIPDCNFNVSAGVAAQDNRAAGGDQCGALTGSSANYGLSQPSSIPDDDVINGFNHRGYNWEFSTSVQQEIIPRKLAVDVAFFRRWYGNFTITDNPDTKGTDYNPYTITVPAINPTTGAADLPLAGQTLTFLDANPSIASSTTTTRDRLSTNYGKQSEVWQGFDFSANVKPGGGTTIQGGISSGKNTTDNCAVIAQVPEGNIPGISLTGAPLSISGTSGTPFCKQQTPWLTQVKGFASYTIPKIDVLISGAFQSVPGPQLAATLVVPNATIQPSLGRALSGGATSATVNILAPGSAYGDRLYQTDIRVGKIVKFGQGRRLTANVDLYNLTNGNAVVQQSSVYPTAAGQAKWGIPTRVQQGRLLKFTASMYF